MNGSAVAQSTNRHELKRERLKSGLAPSSSHLHRVSAAEPYFTALQSYNTIYDKRESELVMSVSILCESIYTLYGSKHDGESYICRVFDGLEG